MKKSNNLKKEDIKNMSYTDFISLLKEENRPPGGKRTIREIMINSFISNNSKVLEVGCTNGFTSLEITRTRGCKVIGVDINKNSLANAKERVKNENVSFINATAYKLPFKNKSFDLVICGNATSFMNNKNKAIKEYLRVTKDWGFIALTPMYYIKKPPIKLVRKVSNIIGSKIKIMTKNQWMKLIKKEWFEIYYTKDYKFGKKSDKQIRKYINLFLNKPHIKSLKEDVKKEISRKWLEIIKIFSKNLTYVGYTIVLLRKRTEVEEKELFNNIKENE